MCGTMRLFGGSAWEEGLGRRSGAGWARRAGRMRGGAATRRTLLAWAARSRLRATWRDGNETLGWRAGRRCGGWGVPDGGADRSGGLGEAGGARVRDGWLAQVGCCLFARNGVGGGRRRRSRASCPVWDWLLFYIVEVRRGAQWAQAGVKGGKGVARGRLLGEGLGVGRRAKAWAGGWRVRS